MAQRFVTTHTTPIGKVDVDVENNKNGQHATTLSAIGGIDSRLMTVCAVKRDGDGSQSVNGRVELQCELFNKVEGVVLPTSNVLSQSVETELLTMLQETLMRNAPHRGDQTHVDPTSPTTALERLVRAVV